MSETEPRAPFLLKLSTSHSRSSVGVPPHNAAFTVSRPGPRDTSARCSELSTTVNSTLWRNAGSRFVPKTEYQYNVCEGEAKNLGPSSGPNRLRDLCTFCTISLDQEEVYRTKVYEKSVSPFYSEDFYFEIPRPFQCLSFYVYAKSMFQIRGDIPGKVHLEMKLNELITENGSICQQLVVQIIACQGLPLISGQNCDPYATVTLVGPARVELWNNGNLAQDVFLGETRVSVKILRNDHVHRAWYLLQPKGNGTKSKPDDLGSLRLKVTYTEDNVLPSACYTALRNLMLKSPDVKPISASAAHVLGDICRESLGEANTIFRGNSLATRCIDDMMKIVGKSYLTVTLKPVLNEIFESNKTCEIDPVKLKEGDNVEVNKENLQGYVHKVFTSITQSSSSCPPLMCDVFRSLRQLASKRFPADPHVQYSAVSSFIFLRFFAVAVLSPHTFQLRSHHPDPEISRTLTLISKTIQSLGSWGSLSKNKLFLDEISSNVSKESSGVEDSFVLKEGEVHKRAQGRKRIGKKNFKKRWLRVTNQELSYHKQKGKEALCVIPVKNILGVEKLEESAFNRKNMFQVIHSEKPLYVQAGNCVETNSWIEVLSQVSRCNAGRLSTFHPSAHVGGSWLCCKEPNENTPGCKPCTATVLANIQLDIDCDRETERIFSFFSSNRPRLQKMEDACAGMSVYLGQQEECSAFTIQDPKETFRTIQELGEVLDDLQAHHDSKGALTDEPGTIENPIVGKTA
ncbi:ras GTPase-activating 2 [Labeo rohita]|uniref:Ras GTPase-activating 2 n=1 Tax=Labeo rohita TaxID=84645 RepID=A0A498M437_LABRO|nr:ras GTPase-activating 2 [Labeo rohita]